MPLIVDQSIDYLLASIWPDGVKFHTEPVSDTVSGLYRRDVIIGCLLKDPLGHHKDLCMEGREKIIETVMRMASYLTGVLASEAISQSDMTA